jgi:hypothetical protein
MSLNDGWKVDYDKLIDNHRRLVEMHPEYGMSEGYERDDAVVAASDYSADDVATIANTDEPLVVSPEEY